VRPMPKPCRACKGQGFRKRRLTKAERKEHAHPLEHCKRCKGRGVI